MRVSILRFDEVDNEYHETELPIELLKDYDNLSFPLLSNRYIFDSEEGNKPIEYYAKIYKD